MNNFEEAISVKKEERIKKTKSAGKVVFVISIVFGGVIGFLTGSGALDNIKFYLSAEQIATVVYNLSIILGLATAVIGSIVFLVAYKRTAKLVDKAQTDDSVFETADKAVDKLSVTVVILFLLDTLFMLVSMKYIMGGAFDENLWAALVAIVMGVSEFLYIAYVQKVNKLNTKLTPNISGEVTDLMPFTTAELQTDEAQKHIMYKAAYKTIGICTNTLISVGAGLMLISAVFGISILYGIGFFVSGAFVHLVFTIKNYLLTHKK